MIFENRFIFFPSHDGDWDTPYENCAFVAEDGVGLHGWLAKADSPSALLWCHGNAGNISHRRDMIEALLTIPVNVFIFDYRGYGRSGGTPGERGLYLDAQAAYRFLSQKFPAERIILFGKSLGGAVAVDLAARVPCAGLIVQSSFTSIPDMAKTVFPFVPKFLVRTKMNSEAKVRSIRAPKLFIHSPEDEVVPFKLGRRLFEAAAEPKEFYEIAGAPHNETWLVGGAAYLRRLRAFVRSCTP